jgi:hypothetical protein
MKVRRVDGEYRVAFDDFDRSPRGRQDEERAAYYTMDAADALETAREMAAAAARRGRMVVRRGSGSAARREVLTPTRLSELESLKHRLRAVVFEQDQDSPRGEKAARLLSRVRGRIADYEAPSRAAAEKAARAEREAVAAYLAVALSASPRPALGRSMEAHRAVEDLAGGRDRAFQLLRLWTRTEEGSVRSGLDIADEGRFQDRVRRRFALAARREGYAPEAVRALLAVQ